MNSEERENVTEQELNLNKVFLHKRDLEKEFGYRSTKLNEFLKTSGLPLVWIGKDCIITREELVIWYKQNVGKEIKCY